MNHSHRVQIRRRRHRLSHVTRRRAFAHASPRLDHIRQRPTRTLLHQYVHVHIILKTPFEPHHVFTRDALVYPNLRSHLRARARLLQRRLRHHLTRVLLPRHRLLHRVHQRESTLPERFPTRVPSTSLSPLAIDARLDDHAGTLHLARAIHSRSSHRRARAAIVLDVAAIDGRVHRALPFPARARDVAGRGARGGVCRESFQIRMHQHIASPRG